MKVATAAKVRAYPAIAFLVWVALTGCVTKVEDRGGVLFIAGGAIDPYGDRYPEFLEEVQSSAGLLGHANPKVAVLPSASRYYATGVDRTVQRLAWTASSSFRFAPLRISSLDYNPADWNAASTELQSATAVWVSGGSQSQLMETLYPKIAHEPVTTVTDAIPEHLERILSEGGVIAGTSAGAAFMGDPMIAGGTSETALLHGASPEGVGLSPGLGLFPFGLLDQHFLARGRIARTLVAMAAAKVEYGFGIEEDSALLVRLGPRPTAEALGPNGICILQQDPKTAGQHGKWQARLTLLSSGDTWDFETNAATPRKDRTTPTINAALAKALDPDETPWSRRGLLNALTRLSRNPNKPQILASDLHVLTLEADGQTQFRISPRNGGELFASQAILRIQLREPGTSAER